jgi:hypothetical protein
MDISTKKYRLLRFLAGVGAGVGLLGRVHAQPHAAVALEAGAERHLEHALSTAQVRLVTDVVHLVPNGRRGGVAVPARKRMRGGGREGGRLVHGQG